MVLWIPLEGITIGRVLYTICVSRVCIYTIMINRRAKHTDTVPHYYYYFIRRRDGDNVWSYVVGPVPCVPCGIGRLWLRASGIGTARVCLSEVRNDSGLGSPFECLCVCVCNLYIIGQSYASDAHVCASLL